MAPLFPGVPLGVCLGLQRANIPG